MTMHDTKPQDWAGRLMVVAGKLMRHPHTRLTYQEADMLADELSDVAVEMREETKLARSALGE